MPNIINPELDYYYVGIPWNDGTTDMLYFDFSLIAKGDSTIRVSSDENNTNLNRSRVITFQGVTTLDNVNPDIQIAATLNVVQQKDQQLIVTFNQAYPVYEEINPVVVLEE